MQQSTKKATIADAEALKRSVTRIAHEILEHVGTQEFVLVGILRRGASIAHMLQTELEDISGSHVDVGSLDISFYRDDIERAITPVLHATNIPFSIDNKVVVLVDDVLYTGRTIRAALDALMDLGRPSAIQLAVVADRGHRELPIRADYVGKNIPSSTLEDVKVLVEDIDGTFGIEIWEKEAKAHA